MNGIVTARLSHLRMNDSFLAAQRLKIPKSTFTGFHRLKKILVFLPGPSRPRTTKARSGRRETR
jgi:hypothetical protein